MAGVIVDWLEFTLHTARRTDVEAQAVISMLGGGTELSRGMFGYEHSSCVLGSGRVAWSDRRADMGVHVSLPSTALGRLEVAAVDFAATVRAAGAKFTRVDLAVDSGGPDGGGVPMSVVQAECGKGAGLVSRFRKGCSIVDLWEPGHTLYLGSAASDCRVRFYDKAAKEKAGAGVWTRCEVQFRRSKADEVGQALADGRELGGYILRVVDFREPSTVGNACRAARLAWWSAWIGACESVRFWVRQKLAEIGAIRAWVEKQVSPTLALLCMTEGGGVWLQDQLALGWLRVPSWRRAWVNC